MATGQPARWLYVLHGIYGAGRNWASVARRVTRERQDWGAVLVDLRQHGASQGFPPPHTIVTAAEDVVRLVRNSGDEAGAVLGHSFGGKVALAVARRALPGLRQVWVVDSTPEAREPGGSAWQMLEVIRSLPDHFASRDDLIGALEGHGLASATAQWMATNLEHHGGAYRWRFDIEALETLLRDFFRTDLWPVVERPPEDVELHIVKAEESSVLSPTAIARIDAAAAKAPVHLHRVAGGHWLNADNPDALVELLVQWLPAADPPAGSG